jgi:hypothetical protein
MLSPIFLLELSHGGVVFSAGADMKAGMQTGRVVDAEPDADPKTEPEPDVDPDAEPDARLDAEPDTEPDTEPDAEPGAEPDAALSMNDGTAVGVGRLLALLIEEWGVWMVLVGLS